ncbi:MAG TPA: cupin domain-containing protein [Gammaproteobacteria bacterium]|nr:cupin domain-containing protein [Gammaproteobacteria bacterium]
MRNGSVLCSTWLMGSLACRAADGDTRRMPALAILGCLALAAGAASAQPSGTVPSSADVRSSATIDRDTVVVPVHHEPHHRQVFQYGTTRILDLQIPPGETSWFHSHDWPVLYMTLGRSAVRTQNLGGEWSGGGPPRPVAGAPPPAPRPAAPPGPRATSTTSYIDKPVTHRIENVGTGLFRAMVVVNETRGDDATSVEAAGFAGTPELANSWFRSYRITLAPGERTPPHKHHEPVVIFQATDGKGMAAGPMKFELNEPGQWAFYDADVEHSVQNLGTAPLDLLEIEVRR